MFKTLLITCAMLFGSTAFGQFTVQVGEKTYYTGYLGERPSLAGARYEQFSKEFIDTLPESWDERTDRGCITPIKNQGSCGSCWAFSRTAALEAAKCIAGKAPTPLQLDLAEQDTVANDRDSSGCSGGYMGFPYEKNHGMTLESVCPYTASNRACRSDPVDTQALEWHYIGSNGNATVDEMRAAVYKYGSVSVTTAAGGSGYDTDADGVFRGCNSRGINHMTNFVGYRKIADGSYQFLMRNSWGTGWGQNGYGWMKQGCNQTGTGSHSAAVVSVDGPGPQPTIKLHAPIEIMASKGADAYVAIKPEAGLVYSWSTGETGDHIWLTADKTMPLELTATDSKGAKVTAVINVTVEQKQ